MLHAKDQRLNGIGELFHNIRFLKFYAWGLQFLPQACSLLIDIYLCTENLWTSNINAKREEELKWRVRENVVDTIISFVWCVAYNSTDAILTSRYINLQDMDTLGGISDRFLSLHCHLQASIDSLASVH